MEIDETPPEHLLLLEGLGYSVIDETPPEHLLLLEGLGYRDELQAGALVYLPTLYRLRFGLRI